MTVNFHSPAIPVRAVLLTIALWGLMAVFSLRPINIRAPAASVLTSALLLGKGIPKFLLTAPTGKSQAKLSPVKGHLLGSFRVTFYWLVEEDAYPGKGTCPLYTRRGELLGRFPDRFVRDFRMESCALLRDGRMISNWEAGNRCQVVDAPLGVDGLALDAFKSVAVDPSIVPMGAKLYIPEADGASLGGNAYHNGLFYVRDVGGLIRGKRIDIYLGTKSNMGSFASTSLCRSGRTEVYLMP
jgi:3D (Asp-Asp-Asp) domain-containing protein